MDVEIDCSLILTVSGGRTLDRMPVPLCATHGLFTCICQRLYSNRDHVLSVVRALNATRCDPSVQQSVCVVTDSNAENTDSYIEASYASDTVLQPHQICSVSCFQALAVSTQMRFGGPNLQPNTYKHQFLLTRVTTVHFLCLCS